MASRKVNLERYNFLRVINTYLRFWLKLKCLDNDKGSLTVALKLLTNWGGIKKHLRLQYEKNLR